MTEPWRSRFLRLTDAAAARAAEAWVESTGRRDLGALDGLARALERAERPARARAVLEEALALARALGRTDAVPPLERRIEALQR